MDPVAYRPLPSAPTSSLGIGPLLEETNTQASSDTVIEIHYDISLEQLQQRLENLRWMTYCLAILICAISIMIMIYEYIKFNWNKN
jgi:hypothetical protein